LDGSHEQVRNNAGLSVYEPGTCRSVLAGCVAAQRAIYLGKSDRIAADYSGNGGNGEVVINR